MASAPPVAAPSHDREVERLRALADSLMTRNLQLEHALQSRIIIEQAKGVLAERYGLGVEDAFDVLRRAARANRMRLHALAEQVVSRRETPEALTSVVAPDPSG